MYLFTGPKEPPSIADRTPTERREIFIELNKLYFAALFDRDGNARDPSMAREDHDRLRQFVWQNVRQNEMHVRTKDNKTWLELVAEPQNVILVNTQGTAWYGELNDGQHRASNMLKVVVRDTKMIH